MPGISTPDSCTNPSNARSGPPLCGRKRLWRPSLFLLPALFALILVFRFLTVSNILPLPDFLLSEEQKFVRFTESVFCSEMSGSTLSMHYTIANPSAFGVDDSQVTLGNASLKARQQSCAVLENYLNTLKTFDYEKLSQKRRLTYDVFRSYLETELLGAPFVLYDEPLSPTLGVQAQLPVLLAEYTFRTKGDIEDYLCLLSQIPDYFSSILAFERDKSEAGLFMSDDSALEVIRQCKDFLADGENNYLLGIFEEKIDAVSNLTADEKIAYKTRNRSLINGYVLPAYKKLISGVAALEGSGRNDKGLAWLPEGKAYYQYLVRSKVGDDRTIEEIEEDIKVQMVADFKAICELTKTQTGAGGSASSQNAAQTVFSSSAVQNGIPAARSSSAMQNTALSVFSRSVMQNGVPAVRSSSAGSVQEQSSKAASRKPAVMLNELRQKITEDFPLLPDVSCQVKYVHPSLQEHLSPAFYLTPAIDDYKNNVIYINPASDYNDLELFTTLAHEGYPGHLYQSVYFNAQSPDLLRCLLDTGGYTEGWATYVEMYSYGLWTENPQEAALAQRNRSFTLGLASLLDIGIHYRGYSLEEVTAFLQKLGFESSTARSLYQSILQTPANYLQYYVGCLNFTSLRDTMKSRQPDTFTLKEFHRCILDIGPAPFSILQKYLPAG